MDNNIEKTEKRKGEAPDSAAGQTTEEVALNKYGFPLFPQPVRGDALDPLNWSFFQKHTILAIVMAMYVHPLPPTVRPALCVPLV